MVEKKSKLNIDLDLYFALSYSNWGVFFLSYTIVFYQSYHKDNLIIQSIVTLAGAETRAFSASKPRLEVQETIIYETETLLRVA